MWLLLHLFIYFNDKDDFNSFGNIQYQFVYYSLMKLYRNVFYIFEKIVFNERKYIVSFI